MTQSSSPNPTDRCPYCGSDTYAEFVYIDMGYYQQVTGYECPACYTIENHPYRDYELTAFEAWCGYRLPYVWRYALLSTHFWKNVYRFFTGGWPMS